MLDVVELSQQWLEFMQMHFKTTSSSIAPSPTINRGRLFVVTHDYSFIDVLIIVAELRHMCVHNKKLTFIMRSPLIDLFTPFLVFIQAQYGYDISFVRPKEGVVHTTIRDMSDRLVFLFLTRTTRGSGLYHILNACNDSSWCTRNATPSTSMITFVRIKSPTHSHVRWSEEYESFTEPVSWSILVTLLQSAEYEINYQSINLKDINPHNHDVKCFMGRVKQLLYGEVSNLILPE